MLINSKLIKRQQRTTSEPKATATHLTMTNSKIELSNTSIAYDDVKDEPGYDLINELINTSFDDDQTKRQLSFNQSIDQDNTDKSNVLTSSTSLTLTQEVELLNIQNDNVLDSSISLQQDRDLLIQGLNN